MNCTLTNGEECLHATPRTALLEEDQVGRAGRLDYGHAFQRLTARTFQTWWGLLEQGDALHVRVQSRGPLRVEVLGPSFELLASHPVERGSAVLDVRLSRRGVHYIRVRNTGPEDKSFLLHVEVDRTPAVPVARPQIAVALVGLLAAIGWMRA